MSESNSTPPERSGLNRRSVLKGMAGVAGVAGVSPLLAACGGSSTSSNGAGNSSSSSSSSTSTGAASSSAAPKASGSTSIGSNASDATPKAAFAAVFAAFTQKTGIKVDVNTVDHNTYQEQINSYLQGNPQDDFMWFSGYRMRFFADKGLATPIDDVWSAAGLTSQYADAVQEAAKGNDGKFYLVPFDYYPWAIFYRKSVWQAKGYQIPKTLDDLKTLAGQMKKDGLIPIAFADKDGWPAMGTFDYIDLRTNGYQFHVDLMAGKQSWTDPKVKQVFATWRELMPYMQDQALGRTWQEAAQTLANKKAGMYLLGSFVAQQFTGDALADLDFFAFPQIDPQWATDTVEAPLDGIMMSKSPKNKPAAAALLGYMGSADAQNTYLKKDPSILSPNKGADTSVYTPLQKRASDFIQQHKHTTQFLDRDTRPDFASTVVLPAFQQFIAHPDAADTILSQMESQKKTIFAS